jgi:hypothetical protein
LISSLPGFSRQAIRFAKILSKMDARIIPDQVGDGVWS